MKTSKYVPFREIEIGNHFYFSSEFEYPFSGMKKGICQKISHRKYKYISDGMVCEVGKISTEVLPVQV